MKQNQNNIECAPTKQEEGVANCLFKCARTPMLLLLPLVWTAKMATK